MADGFTMRDAPAPEKHPLYRPLPPAPPFPADALGALRDAAEAVQLRTQAPMAICAQSVLAAATLAVQAQRDVELPGGGRKPLTGLFASVADSGERKSSVDRLALAPVYRVEAEWREQSAAAFTAYANDHAAWKEAREVAKKKHKGDRAAIRTALDASGPEPQPPPHPMLLIADPTPEALVLHLAEGRPWAGVFTAEGGILVGGAAFNDDTRMRTGALFNMLWDGEPIRRRRVLTGAAFLPGRRCSAHVMMQPAVADKLFGDSMLDGIGMLARTLLVAPESTAGTRRWREAPWECAAVLDAYNDSLRYLLQRPPVMADGSPSVLDPPPMWLSHEATALWVRFHDHAEACIGAAGDWRPIRAFGAKAAEHAGRLAAVLAVYADPDAMEVTGEAMAGGIALAQHYAAELLRLQGTAGISPDLRLAQRLLAWWQARRDPALHLAAVYQRGLNALGDAATARRIVGILEDHGWAVRLPSGAEVEGAPRREAWTLAR
ncbi:hypothetical protein GCM10011504_40530 [Siccirubricoccus deserti]|uniref:DUF3987 domain-containing protein n=1 Tax=Siccirubricoccus deserti TaxID=2013562 RepID=A0A9X0R289_9PROT|nr:YfjI family protein [Siccirubricoccus deserti]MBC4017317.1 DUF3987 domain-containing protein [Siccirubricoccus deserti]GGC58165.1 hypothetical protein GCM10011504_40530 [Siccirubricoccus deserti]